MARTPGSEGGGERLRLFVALDLPEEARQSIAAWRDALTAGRGELRPVPAGQLHVTLVFLGWQDAAAVPRIAEAGFGAAEGLATPAPVLRAAGVKPVPPRRPRLLALDLKEEGGRAGALHARVSSALEGLGVYTPEKRPFWPHVTLARVRRGARFTLSTEEVSNVNVVATTATFEASALTLYRSTLRPQGAVYEPLARLNVGGGSL